ncbi:MAG: hypothetical protein OXS35_09950, partial [Dehalococcoidia bacterium]|nr:hypothetical protein [Dehalococcoidia bacterium]
MLADTVEEFLAGRWAEVSRKFVYATGASANTTALSNEIERLTARLAKHSIEFEVWDQEDLSKKLKGHPEIVDDFFGRPWV